LAKKETVFNNWQKDITVEGKGSNAALMPLFDCHKVVKQKLENGFEVRKLPSSY
jgi:hypothetical protein